ncbi:MAG TPA: hypothetical protein VGQ53_23855 [Chitinophagaceae bacterium]|jgi:hypothetical protein|nr:hypothetical protein [Chitinophagaceae bacterium]
MKKTIAFSFFAMTIANILCAQSQTAQLLKQPADWQFERFTLPPEFAPNIPYKGVEELRFSPGMFVKDSANYFTYAFVAELDNINSISKDNIKDYLLEYFKGLCSSTAKQRKLSIDTSKITVSVDKDASTGKDDHYNATLNIFGVFADGAPVRLNMEIKVMKDKAASKLYLVFIGSPLSKSDEVWTKLRSIQNNFIIP